MTDLTIEPITVAILAGGRSRRMGQDKALLRLTKADPTFLGLTLARIRDLSDDVMVIGRELTEPEPGIRCIADRFPNAGPLGGMATALSHAKHDRCLILSCDLPFLSTGVLRFLMSLTGEEDALIPVSLAKSRQGGHRALQTLHAIYRRTCLAPIELSLEQGNYRTTSWLLQVTVRQIAAKELLPFDPELLTFFSVNTPEDLVLARSILAR